MSWLPLNPIPLKDRVSMIFLQYGQIDVIDGAFVLIDKTGFVPIFLSGLWLVLCSSLERVFLMLPFV